MSEEEAPKSAFELAMERLRKKDKDDGVDDRPVTPAQREAIAEARRVAEARLAEREILHHSAVKGVMEPEGRERLDEEYRRDRDRITYDRDKKIEEIRKG